VATLLNRGLSGAVAFTYLALAYFRGSGLDAAKVAVALLLPMACIWFFRGDGRVHWHDQVAAGHRFDAWSFRLCRWLVSLARGAANFVFCHATERKGLTNRCS